MQTPLPNQAPDRSELARQRELFELLTTLRARIHPDHNGSCDSRRRRGHGITQEEAAHRIGIAPRTYAAIERGEVQSPSPEVLERITQAMRMQPGERAAFYALIGRYHPPPLPTRSEVSDEARHIVDGVLPMPALVIDHAWNVLHWNESLPDWFPPAPDVLPLDERNIQLYYYTRYAEQWIVDLERERAEAMSALRFFHAHHPGDALLTDLLDRLLRDNQAYDLWRQVEICPGAGVRRCLVNHPRYGRTDLFTIATPLPNEQRLLISTPRDLRYRWPAP
jgi:transcriptional regulator with XRE-family HTH domain